MTETTRDDGDRKVTKETPRAKLSAEELIDQIVRYTYTRFQSKGKWYYVKQVSKKEYEKA